MTQAMNFLSQLLSALAYLEEHNTVHRDIKPSNVLLSQNNKIKLADFGLACSLNNANVRTGILGTYAYCAPERIAKNPEKMKRHDNKSDMWSTGCTTYEMLTGQRPIQYMERESFRKKMNSSSILESIDYDKLPSDIVRLLKQMMAWEQYDRPTANEAKEVVDKYLQIESLDSGFKSL